MDMNVQTLKHKRSFLRVCVFLILYYTYVWFFSLSSADAESHQTGHTHRAQRRLYVRACAFVFLAAVHATRREFRARARFVGGNVVCTRAHAHAHMTCSYYTLFY